MKDRTKEAQEKEERLGTMPVGRLIATMSLPMMVSFFIQALYNIVDSIFVSRISENALTAVSLAYPMQMVAHAIAVGIGVGINASVPRYLGKGEPEKARRAAGNAFSLDFVVWMFFLVLGLTAVPSIYRAQTDVAEIVEDGSVYLSICWCILCGEMFGQFFEKLLVASGQPVLAMVSQSSGAIFNIVFDPLLIFGIGPFPEMGIAGAAAATVGGQILAAAVSFILNVRRNGTSMFGPKDLLFDGQTLRELLGVGFPTMITIGLTSVTGFCINQVLLGYSTTAAAVYGIWVKLQNFCMMPLFGMNNGLVPILSYNNARNLQTRVWETVRIALTFAICLMSVLTVVLELIPGPILRLFSASGTMMEIGVTALRWCILSLPFGGVCIILTSTMQSLQHSRYTLLINILRQLVFIISLFVLISAITHQLSAVWAAVPCAEALSCVTAVHFEKIMYRDLHGKEKNS